MITKSTKYRDEIQRVRNSDYIQNTVELRTRRHHWRTQSLEPVGIIEKANGMVQEYITIIFMRLINDINIIVGCLNI